MIVRLALVGTAAIAVAVALGLGIVTLIGPDESTAAPPPKLVSGTVWKFPAAPSSSITPAESDDLLLERLDQARLDTSLIDSVLLDIAQLPYVDDGGVTFYERLDADLSMRRAARALVAQERAAADDSFPTWILIAGAAVALVAGDAAVRRRRA